MQTILHGLPKYGPGFTLIMLLDHISSFVPLPSQGPSINPPSAPTARPHQDPHKTENKKLNAGGLPGWLLRSALCTVSTLKLIIYVGFVGQKG